MKTRVRNLGGSSNYPKPTCRCGTWIDHWIENKQIRPGYCRGCGAKTTNLVGGHVYKVGSFDKQRYIIPICYSCNNTPGLEFNVDESDLVSANCNNCKNK